MKLRLLRGKISSDWMELEMGVETESLVCGLNVGVDRIHPRILARTPKQDDFAPCGAQFILF